MGKTKLPIICRSLIPKILEAVPRAMNNQPVTRTTAKRWASTTEQYLKRRRRVRYLPSAITVNVQRDTVPRHVVIMVFGKPTTQKSLPALSYPMAKRYTEYKG